MRKVLPSPRGGKILYRHRAHLNTLRQGHTRLPDNRNNQLEIHLQPFKAIITACNFKPVKYTPRVVPQPNLDSPFGQKTYQQTNRIPPGTSNSGVHRNSGKNFFFNNQPKHQPVTNRDETQTPSHHPGGQEVPQRTKSIPLLGFFRVKGFLGTQITPLFHAQLVSASLPLVGGDASWYGAYTVPVVCSIPTPTTNS